MPLYRVTLGNVTARKGHRRDCGQLRAVFTVRADSEEHAHEEVGAFGTGTLVPVLYLGAVQEIDLQVGPGVVRVTDVERIE